MNKDTNCELSLSDDTFVLPLLSASSPLSSLRISNLFNLIYDQEVDQTHLNLPLCCTPCAHII